jgi:TorA maturation chaperone TorD
LSGGRAPGHGDVLRGPERSLARSGAYALFGALYRKGVTPELVDGLRDLPALAEALPDPIVPDLARAEHHDLFSVQVPPYAGAFLEEDGTVGGASAEPARHLAALLGVDPGQDGTAPDHLAVELELLSMLAGDEARGVAGARELAHELLAGHLLWWLPPFTLAVAREGRPFWTLVVDITLELAVEQGAVGSEAQGPLPAAPAVPSLAERLEDGELARGLEIPSGFGGRRATLETLLGSAREYGEAPRLADALLAEIDVAKEHHEVIAARFDVLRPVSVAWMGRLEAAGRVCAAWGPGGSE